MKHMVPLILVCTVLLLVPAIPAQVDLVTNDDISQYFWRTDQTQVEIVDSRIFPHVQMGGSGNLQNLGEASIVWTIEVDGGYIPAYAIYDRGQRSEIRIVDKTYDTIKWFGVLENIAMIGVKGNVTDIILVTADGSQVGTSFAGKTIGHQIFVSPSGFFIWANNTSTDQAYYYVLQNTALISLETSETVLSAGLGAAIIRNNNDERIFFTDSGNVTIDDSVSDSIQIGHVMLNPVIFDMENQFIYFPDNSTIEFPAEINKFSFFGLQSSLVFDNGTIYELSVNQVWTTIANFPVIPLDFAIVDIGLYIGPVKKAGIGLIMEGRDEDGDDVPDAMEDYYGSLNTKLDTDGDGISDKAEIFAGLNPAVADATLDYDGDRLSNIDEISQGLDPRNPDSDYGGALDGWEIKYNFDPTDKSDDSVDRDNDGVSNAVESQWNSNPRKTDTDDDGMPDGWEIENTIDPTIDNADDDPDGDGLTNLQEYQGNTDPLVFNPETLFQGLNIEIILILAFCIPVGSFMARKITQKLPE